MEIDYEDVRELVELALAEDIGTGDITTRALFREEEVTGEFIAREEGVLCGLALCGEIIARHAPGTGLRAQLAEGAAFGAGAVLGRLAGRAVDVLPLERVLLNFVQRLSGIATATRQYVEAVAGTGASIYDTRKTTPGWRKLEKYAVRVGGGMNHREGLFDAVLLKDNHIALARRRGMRLSDIVAEVRGAVGKDVFFEVEIDTLGDLEEVLGGGVNAVLLDNMTVEELSEGVARVRELGADVELEASGRITLESVRRVAETGVSRISVGALTHSVRALDIALECSF